LDEWLQEYSADPNAAIVNLANAMVYASGLRKVTALDLGSVRGDGEEDPLDYLKSKCLERGAHGFFWQTHGWAPAPDNSRKHQIVGLYFEEAARHAERRSDQAPNVDAQRPHSAICFKNAEGTWEMDFEHDFMYVNYEQKDLTVDGQLIDGAENPLEYCKRYAEEHGAIGFFWQTHGWEERTHKHEIVGFYDVVDPRTVAGLQRRRDHAANPPVQSAVCFRK
jgi:hypothetical protein